MSEILIEFIQLFLLPATVLYFVVYTLNKNKKGKPPSLFFPKQKRLDMIGLTGKNVDPSEDAVFISIPIEAFRDEDFDFSALFNRIATIKETGYSENAIRENRDQKIEIEKVEKKSFEIKRRQKLIPIESTIKKIASYKDKGEEKDAYQYVDLNDV